MHHLKAECPPLELLRGRIFAQRKDPTKDAVAEIRDMAHYSVGGTSHAYPASINSEFLGRSPPHEIHRGI